MALTPAGLRIDDPAKPLLKALIAYWGHTSGAGAATGMTLVCADLDNHPSYVGSPVKILLGGSDGQARTIQTHAVGGVLTVDSAFTDNTGAVQQITANTPFVILTAMGGGGGGGGMPPTTGLWMFGIVSAAQVASTTVIDIPHLAGFQDNTFNEEFYMQVLHAGGALPEEERRVITDYDGATGRFTTQAFTANVEAGDIVAIYHSAILAVDIIVQSTLTLGDMINPEDNSLAGGLHPPQGNAFRGCLLMPTNGPCAFIPRLILAYTALGGIFTLDEGNPFPVDPGQANYVILKFGTQFTPLVYGVDNLIPAHVIGNKEDTAVMVPSNTSSVIRYLKGLLTFAGVTRVEGTQATTAALDIINAAIEDTRPFTVSGLLSLNAMTAGETFLVVEEIRDRDDATYREYARNTYVGVQTSPMLHFTEKVCQGWRVRIQRTGGADRNVTYQFFRRG